MRSRNPDKAAECMKEVMKHGNKGEVDLFVARAYLDFLARCDTPETARRLIRHFDDVAKTPLLRFVGMLEELINVGDFGLLKSVKQDYETEIARDPSLMLVRLIIEELFSIWTKSQ